MSSDCEYVAVTNIPSNFHAADLRAHFSSLVESNSFLCFHFRHRPEKVDGHVNENRHNDLKRCCVVKVLKTKLVKLLRYDREHWTNVSGDFIVDKCQVSPIRLKYNRENNEDAGTVEEEKLLQMPELNPPELMPNGNVGTPTLLFLDLIQRCLLPHNLINKLQLKFPGTAAKRIYGNVKFDYEVSDSHKDRVKIHISSKQKNRATEFKRIIYHCKDTESNEEKCPEFLVNESSTCMDAVETLNRQQVLDPLTNTSSSHSSPLTSSRIQSISPVKETYTCKHSDETSTSQLVLDTLTETSSLHHLSDSVKTKLMHETDLRNTRLKQGTCLSSVPTTCSLDQYGSQTAKLSEEKLSTSNTSAGKFLVPPALPVRENSKKLTNRERKMLEKEEKRRIKKLKAENIEERLIAVEKRYHNDDDAEEWDRHEASVDDPSNQERNTERLYDEEIEQPWEKGGPGVVFYTDAMFWQEKEGDFDEQTTDDLDVDFSAYEEPGAGDKDIKDFLRIRQERRFREGYDDTDRFSIGIGKKQQESSRSSPKIGKFECYSKGIGRKVMERQGWKEGQGLGRSQSGIVKALKGEGQTAHSKRGLGYTDMEPVRYGFGVSKASRSQSHLITSVYDDPKTTDPKEPLLQRSELSTLKHRQSHLEKFS